MEGGLEASRKRIRRNPGVSEGKRKRKEKELELNRIS